MKYLFFYGVSPQPTSHFPLSYFRSPSPRTKLPSIGVKNGPPQKKNPKAETAETRTFLDMSSRAVYSVASKNNFKTAHGLAKTLFLCEKT
jgi:hypothetical protein